MRRALLALLFVAACSDDEGPIIDAPGPVDAGDAMDADPAAIDAAMIDAAQIDAAAIDAPAIDAAVDAMPIDATPIDAPPLPQNPGWPATIYVGPLWIHFGSPKCGAFGDADLAWGHFYAGTFGTQTPVGLDGTRHGEGAQIPAACTVEVTHDGRLLFAFPHYDNRLHQRPGGDASLGDPGQDVDVLDIVAIDPAGGAVVRSQLSWPPDPNPRFQRVRFDLTRDLAFGTGGVVPSPTAIGRRVVQGGTASPYVTMVIGTDLIRMDVRTGALVTAFGGDGSVDLGFPAAELLGMVALPDGRLGLVRRGAGNELIVDRLDASGAVTSGTITMPALAHTVGADAAGRVVAGMTGVDGTQLLVRFHAIDNTLDMTFGTGGRMAVYASGAACPSGTGSFQPGVFHGVFGNGRLVFRGAGSCSGGGPINPTTYPYNAYHLHTP